MSPVNRAVRMNVIAIAIVATLMAVLVVWAAVAEIVQSAHAQGLVIASSRTQVVQVAVDGVVSGVLVAEGQRVSKGEVLAQLDRSQAGPALFDTQAKIAALNAALARLRTEVFGQALVFPKELKDYPNFVANQTELLHRRQSALNDDIATLQKSLKLLEQELEMTRPLLSTGDISKAELLRLERQAADLTGQISTRRNKYFQDAQAEMTKAEEELATQKQVLADRTALFERTEILAPADGLVKSIQTTTPGARVRAGDVILELVPTTSELIVEVKLRPTDISQMRVGLPTSLKFDAYDYSIYGTIRGTVKYISPDVLSERTAQGESIFYRIQIKIDRAQIDEHNRAYPDKRIDIQPGMTCVADIVTGYRTVLSYLTKPISKTFSESLRER